jgi:uncharacterized lipoprotein YddW (UPF0748 family)
LEALPRLQADRARPSGGSEPSTSSPRALWIVRNTLASRAETERAVEDCARIGCSLLFLQVSGRWDAYFPSELFPKGQSAGDAEADNLALAIELAHARGIRVHAWVNSLLAWSAAEPPRDRAHVYHRHPEWFLVGQDGRSILERPRRELDRLGIEGYFLEPRVPEVRAELRRLVLELVTRYDLDGIHLDYIRLPSAAWGFHTEIRERYRDETGVDPLELYTRERELAAQWGAERLMEAREAWQAWHRDAITRLVRLVSEDVKAVRADLELSAAVLANPRSARDDFGQDWTAWLEERLLDVAVPMVYRSSASEVLSLLEAIHQQVDPAVRLYAGVSLEFLDAEEIPPIEGLMGRYGVDGLALFSYDLLRDDRRAMRLLSGAR